VDAAETNTKQGTALLDETMMRAALDEARAASEREPPDVPVGAIVAAGGRIVARGHNQVEARRDPTLHAEVVAIREAARVLGSPRLDGATLYVTVEPCLMCAGAIVLARIDRVVIGCDDPKAGAVTSLYTALSDARLNHRCRVVRGVLAEESADLLRAFFARRRAPA